MNKRPTIILASKSPSRALILKSTGIPFETRPADIDEGVLKKQGQMAKKTPEEIGILLAREKALKVSNDFPEKLVIGADQILELEGEIFDKPENMGAARETLQKLRGKTHTLISCVALAFQGEIKIEFQEKAYLTMKNFSEEFLDDYLNQAGPGILTSVGAYQLEALGKILFENIEGDFYTILGLPRDRLLTTFESISAGKEE